MSDTITPQATYTHTPSIIKASYREKLIKLLSDDLDFHDKDSGYASHNYHSFPAKFPPQLPRKFIHELTFTGDLVLDPMMGSGTTIVEALLSGKRSIGTDIDPLAVKIATVKTSPIQIKHLKQKANKIIAAATIAVTENSNQLEKKLENRWDHKTKEFIDYWFAKETQIELLALVETIEEINDPGFRAFFELVFSAIIITKSGGVSLAFDLAHTRPHRAKIVYSYSGDLIVGAELTNSTNPRIKFLTKKLRSPIVEFEKRFKQNINDTITSIPDTLKPKILYCNAQELPIDENSIDLIVTSPPYAANAIDYMRAHKFSLVWLGKTINDLGKKRQEYIGGDATTSFEFENLPPESKKIVLAVANVDAKKGKVLHRYYSEMIRVLQEMHRVLKPGKAAIVVVGNTIMRGLDTKTAECLAEIGEMNGFQIPKIGIRNIDRNRRMMPAGMKTDTNSQIQQRMHQEFVIGFYKPA